MIICNGRPPLMEFISWFNHNCLVAFKVAVGTRWQHFRLNWPCLIGLVPHTWDKKRGRCSNLSRMTWTELSFECWNIVFCNLSASHGVSETTNTIDESNFTQLRNPERPRKQERKGVYEVRLEEGESGRNGRRKRCVSNKFIIFPNHVRDSLTPLCTAPVLWLIIASRIFMTLFNYRTMNEICRLKRLGNGKSLHVLHTSSSVYYYLLFCEYIA